jgi:tetratricopeptide (TPR) repeat protein
MAIGEQGVRIAEAVDHPLSCIGAYWGVGYVSLRQGDFQRAIPCLEHALDLFQVVPAPVWFSFVTSTLSLAYAMAGRRAEALKLPEQRGAWMQTRTSRTRTSRVVFFVFTEVYLRVGLLEEASAYARDALAFARTRKERGDEAWTLRLLGDIATQHEPLQHESAETYYRQALALAEELGMRPLQAHCHHGFGTLYAKIDRREQACTELSTAIEMYQSMDMTFWLPQAEAALAQVKGR